jgi:serine/threonine-protein kinase RsbW
MGMEIKVALDLPRDAVSVPVTRQILDGCLRTLGVTPNTCADIALALSEACANVIQHAGPGEEYEVRISAKNSRCMIEVINVGIPDGKPVPNGSGTASFPNGYGLDAPREDCLAPGGDPVSAIAEHGRGLQIIDAVADNVQLTGNQQQGTTMHFEKALDWLPGAAGKQLLSVDEP